MEIVILGPHEVSVEEYKNLRLEALLEEPQAFGSSYKDHKDLPDEKWQEWHSNYKSGERDWMVFAEMNGELIGMAGAYQTDENIKKNEANIIAVYVTKKARGNGVSKLLMNKLLNVLKNSLIKKAKLAVNKDQTAAVKLYESFGFIITGKDNMVLGDGIAHEEYVMEKDI